MGKNGIGGAPRPGVSALEGPEDPTLSVPALADPGRAMDTRTGRAELVELFRDGAGGELPPTLGSAPASRPTAPLTAPTGGALDGVPSHGVVRAALPDLIRDARAAADAGRSEEAIGTLLAVVNDARAAPEDRAKASIAACEIALVADATSARAETFYLRAKELAPRLDVRMTQVMLFVAQRRAQDALPIIQQLRTERPNDWQVARALTAVLLSNADRPGALVAANEAVRLAQAAGVTGNDMVTVRLAQGWVLYENKRGAESIPIYQELLRTPGLSPELAYRLHHSISELLPAPKFTGHSSATRVGPDAAEINRLFSEGSTAFNEGRYEDARRLADQILALDPNDGMAHRMWSISYLQTKEMPPLLPQLDTTIKQRALIAQVNLLASQAHNGTGRIQQLFPDWDRLNLEQQASIAQSILAYGPLIPLVINAGATYRFGMAGESCAFLDPLAHPDTHNAWGRHDYAGRGWWNPENNVIVTGVEDLNRALHGGYNTVAHEFAHLVHGVITSAERLPDDQRTPVLRELAAYGPRIRTLFAEAKARANGQSMLDSYSSNDAFEYFGQAMEALINPTPRMANRLFSVNPHMWALCNEFISRFRQFPAQIGGIDFDHGTNHPQVGSAANGSPMNLQAIIDNPATSSEVRALAVAQLDHYRDLYLPPQAAVLANVPTRPAALFKVHNGPLTFAPAIAVVTAASEGRFDTAITGARGLEADIRAGRLNENDTRQALTALGQATRAAAEQSAWSAVDIFLAIVLGLLTLGIVAGIMADNRGEARAAADATRAAETTAREHFLWRQAGREWALDAGPLLTNYRASHGDLDVRVALQTEVQAKHPQWTPTEVQSVVALMMQGMRDADAASQSGALNAHADLITADSDTTRRHQALVTARATDLGGIAAGSFAINYISQPPEMIAVMGFNELDAQIGAELLRVQQRIATAPIPTGDDLTQLTETRQALQRLRSSVRAARDQFSSGRRGAGELAATLATLRGVPAVANSRGLLQLHLAIG